MKICCVKSNLIPEEILNETKSFKRDFSFIKNNEVEWIDRKDAETDFSYKQLIPYVILQKSDKTLGCYQRHGTEKRLHGLFSCGFGGHVEESDYKNDLVKTLECGMLRELSEELSNFDKDQVELKYLGLINEKESEVGLVHLGIVFMAVCKEGYTPKEASETKGLEWKSKEELCKLKTELWTKLALELVE